MSTKGALIKMARADSVALMVLVEELRDELHMYGDEARLDTGIILPLCKEIQAKSQAIFGRVEACVEESQDGGVQDQ